MRDKIRVVILVLTGLFVSSACPLLTENWIAYGSGFDTSYRVDIDNDDVCERVRVMTPPAGKDSIVSAVLEIYKTKLNHDDSLAMRTSGRIVSNSLRTTEHPEYAPFDFPDKPEYLFYSTDHPFGKYRIEGGQSPCFEIVHDGSYLSVCHTGNFLERGYSDTIIVQSSAGFRWDRDYQSYEWKHGRYELIGYVRIGHGDEPRNEFGCQYSTEKGVAVQLHDRFGLTNEQGDTVSELNNCEITINRTPIQRACDNTAIRHKFQLNRCEITMKGRDGRYVRISPLKLKSLTMSNHRYGTIRLKILDTTIDF